MSSKPTGNVTFLFTDIEGSTKLAQEYPDTLQPALEIHHSILRNAVESNSGFVFEIVGDAFCCAFENADDAVKAAVEAQINLSKQKWEDAVIKIRIGIHSGNAEWNGTRYMGYITLARTARVMSAAFGEQIIISNDVYELTKDKFGSHHKDTKTLSEKKNIEQNSDVNISIPNQEIGKETESNLSSLRDFEVSFRDLGDRRLKDLKQPVKLFQILSKGLREDFPPLKTLDARPNNLPVQLTSFIGREAEMKSVKDLLKQTHLITLTGSGGAGKTRFALQVGADVIDDYANGVWFVELAALSEPAFLPQAIMKVFDLKEEPKRSLEDTLCDYLREKEILIILDNCEHLVDACAILTEKLLSSSPKLKIIATSREGLRCDGEQTHRVASLEVPDPKDENTAEQLSHYEAVRLFIERALAVDETFRVNNNNAPALAGICHQLDGIPLAIELAAARTKILSVEKIYERLNDRFNLLTGGKRTALPRQQTLKALIDWSYDLLSEKEKLLWARLSVFSGGWTLEAAEEVCWDEGIRKEEVLELLDHLTEKSIVIFERGKDRYGILETLKQYGEEKLKEANATENVMSKHLNYYMEFAETAEYKLNQSEALHWLEKLEADHHNLQSAIELSAQGMNKEKRIRLAGALWSFWQVRGHFKTAEQMLKNILDNTQAVSKSVLGKVQRGVGLLAKHQGKYEKAKSVFEENLALQSEIGDKHGIAKSLMCLGTVLFAQGDYVQAQKLFEESLALLREIGNKHSITICLTGLSQVFFKTGDYLRAKKISEESLSLGRKLGDKYGIAKSLSELGAVSNNLANYDQAQRFFEESLILRREIGDKGGIAKSLNDLGIVEYCLGKYELARKYYEESMTLNRELGDKSDLSVVLYNLGIISYNQGNFEQAEKIFQESLILKRDMGEKNGIAHTLNNLGLTANCQGKYEQAMFYFEESLRLGRQIEDKSGIGYYLCNIGVVTHNQGNYAKAKIFYEESLALSREIGDKGGIADSLYGLGNLARTRRNYEQAQKLYEESLVLSREIGDKNMIANSLSAMGKIAGNIVQAKIYFEESLKISSKMGQKLGIIETLIGFVEILCENNELIQAVILLGALETMISSRGIVLDINDRRLHTKISDKLYKKLSEEEFSKYFEEGKKLTLEQAAELALSIIK